MHVKYAAAAYVIIIIIIIIIKCDTSNNRATGTISKSFRKYVSNITGNREVRELQKTAILGPANIHGRSQK